MPSNDGVNESISIFAIFRLKSQSFMYAVRIEIVRNGAIVEQDVAPT